MDRFYLLIGIPPFLLLFILLWLYRSKKRLASKKMALLWFWNIALTLFLLSLTFFTLESYYRFWVDRTDSYALNKISQRWLKRHYQLNNFTVRDNIDYKADIASGKRRLTIFGDSFTAGHGIKNVDNRFANQLRKMHPNWEIHVMAYNGLNSADQLDILNHFAEGNYEFDIILLAYCLNDADYLLPETKEIYERIYAFNENLGYWGRNSYFINTWLFRNFAQQDPDFLNYSDFVASAYQGSYWLTQQKVLRDYTNLAKSLSKEFYVITYPFMQERQKGYQFHETHRKLKLFWEKQNVPHLDLFSSFANYPDEELMVNAYDAHPNEKAHRICALEIGKKLKVFK